MAPLMDEFRNWIAGEESVGVAEAV